LVRIGLIAYIDVAMEGMASGGTPPGVSATARTDQILPEGNRERWSGVGSAAKGGAEGGFDNAKRIARRLFSGISTTRAVLTRGAKFLENELPPPLVNNFGEKKFVKCYVRAPGRDANLNDPFGPPAINP
jgi:hypothetical protein